MWAQIWYRRHSADKYDGLLGKDMAIGSVVLPVSSMEDFVPGARFQAPKSACNVRV